MGKDIEIDLSAENITILRQIASGYYDGIFEDFSFKINIGDSEHLIEDLQSALSFIYNFNPIKSEDLFIYQIKPVEKKIEGIKDFLEDVYLPKLKESFSIHFGDELDEDRVFNLTKNSIENEKHSILLKKIFDSSFNSNLVNFFNYIFENNLENDRSFWAKISSFKGHPLHPFAKLRAPLKEGANELNNFIPELGLEFKVKILAIKKNLCKFVFEGSEATFLEAIKRTFNFQEDKYEDCFLIPIHPLELETYKMLYSEHFASNDIILTDLELPVRSNISTRSLIVGNDLGDIKVSLPSYQITGGRRVLKSDDIDSIPFINNSIREIISSDQIISENLRITRELGGIYFERKVDKHDLSFILKASENASLKDSEFSIPLAAFFAFSPTSKKPLIIDFLEHYNINTESKINSWFACYAEQVISGQLDLMLKYGVCLEGHQQNSRHIFNKATGMPISGFAQDIAGGARINKEIFDLNYKLSSKNKLNNYREGNITYLSEQFNHTTIGQNLISLASVLANHIDQDLSKEKFSALKSIIIDKVEESINRCKDHKVEEGFEKIYKAQLSEFIFITFGALSPTKCLSHIAVNQAIKGTFYSNNMLH
ncbi:MAG: IucA/IucC family protein [Rickettsiales bacterium]|nr:IucA/IucC family protein [Rickettsiales bacterium]